MNKIIQHLISAHLRLNREIRSELARNFPNGLKLAQLKKQRLAIKDRLFRIIPDASEMRRVARVVMREARPA